MDTLVSRYLARRNMIIRMMLLMLIFEGVAETICITRFCVQDSLFKVEASFFQVLYNIVKHRLHVSKNLVKYKN